MTGLLEYDNSLTLERLAGELRDIHQHGPRPLLRLVHTAGDLRVHVGEDNLPNKCQYSNNNYSNRY